MKNIRKIFIFLMSFTVLSACSVIEVEDMVDPNGLSLDGVTNNPNQKLINQLGVGVQSVMRNGYLDFIRVSGTVGRETVYSASTDNRYFNELLGTESANFNGANDPNGIFNTYYSSYSQTRRRAEVFMRSAATATVLNDAQKAGISGFCKTVQGYVMLNLLNMQGKNGIRESFGDLTAPGDLLKPGKFGTYESGLALVKKTLDEGAADLDRAGSTFAFPMTAGWAGYDTPARFKMVNRGLAARTAMFQKDFAGMLTILPQSFLNASGDITAGPVFTYSTTAGDFTNDLFRPVNDAGAPYVVFNEHIAAMEAGDTRASKLRQRTTPRQSGLFINSTHEVALYANNTSSASIIRNEELILMWAEAKIQTGALADGVAALNTIRAAAGLASLAQAKPNIVGSKDGLIDEVLHQRRYSLFFEGHRWFDAKRSNKISILPLQTGTFKVFENMNRPDAEVQWDVRNPQ